MIRIRAEENALLIWNAKYARTAYISDEELNCLERWTNGENSGFSERLKKHGIICDAVKLKVKEAILEAKNKKTPPHSFCAPESLHIELTSHCPLNCPQCYKNCSGTDLSFKLLLDAIKQAMKCVFFKSHLEVENPLFIRIYLKSFPK